MIHCTAGTHTIRCLSAIGGSACAGLAVVAGTVRFSGLIDTSACSTTRPVQISSTGVVILDGVTLIANAAMESIYASSGKSVKVYNGCVANKAKHANITVQVGTLTVDTNVV